MKNKFVRIHAILSSVIYSNRDIVSVVDIPEDLIYTENHEWLQVIDRVAYIGLSEYARDALGEIVFVEMLEPGDKVSKGDEILNIESTKVAQGLIAPLSGIIVDVNEDLKEEPDRINSDPLGNFIYSIQISDAKELDSHMNAEQYRKFISGPD